MEKPLRWHWSSRATVLGCLILLALGFLGGLLVESNRVSRIADLGVTILTDEADSGLVMVPRLSSMDAVPAGGDVYLVDKQGTVVKDWKLDHEVAGHVELLPDGDLVYLGRADDLPEQLPPGQAGILQRVNWEGDEVWTYEDPHIHHDFELLSEGSMALLRWSVLPDELAGRVRGGLATPEAEGLMYADEILEVSPDGSERVVWNASWTLDPTRDAIPEDADRLEWTHGNSIRYLSSNPINGDEAYLISLRQLSLVLIVSRQTGEILWRYGGQGVLHNQHDAQLLDNGNVLLFDNGQTRSDSFPSSEAQEINPLTDEVVWRYGGRGVFGWRLFSSVISGVQRLPNGNTLITEGMSGRLVEVTPEKEVVWEFVNPFYREEVGGGPNQAIFKARSYPADLLAGLNN